jgi:hypothetical protein
MSAIRKTAGFTVAAAAAAATVKPAVLRMALMISDGACGQVGGRT